MVSAFLLLADFSCALVCGAVVLLVVLQLRFDASARRLALLSACTMLAGSLASWRRITEFYAQPLAAWPLIGQTLALACLWWAVFRLLRFPWTVLLGLVVVWPPLSLLLLLAAWRRLTGYWRWLLVGSVYYALLPPALADVCVLLVSPLIVWALAGLLRSRLFDPLERLNEQLAERARRDMLILQVAQTVRLSTDLQQVLALLVDHIERSMGYRGVQIRLEDSLQAGRLGNGRRRVFALQGSTFKGELEVELVQESSEELEMLAVQLSVLIDNASLFVESEQQRERASAASESKSRFLSTMSHELRTPLQSVMAFTGMMLEGGPFYGEQPLPVVYRDDLRRIQISSDHLFSLIRDVLDLNRIEAGKLDLQLEALAVADLVEGSVSQIANLVRTGVTLSLQLPADLPLVLGDRLRLKQVLLNLLSNAAKFCEQGSIVVQASGSPERVRIAVIDSGPGISEHAAARLFGRFEQGDGNIFGKHGGSGLGLSICKQLVELHGGRIGFESVLGRGSTFYFDIPCVGSRLVEVSTLPIGDDLTVYGRQRRPQCRCAVLTSAALAGQTLLALEQRGWKPLLYESADRAIEMGQLLHAPLILIGASEKPAYPVGPQVRAGSLADWLAEQ